MAEPAESEAWGVLPRFWDIGGSSREAPGETVAAILQAMGAATPSPAASDRVLVIRGGQAHPFGGRARLVTEAGETIEVDGRLPADLPLGYHTLHRPDDTAGIRVIVSPGACHLPEDLRDVGLSVQVYALRSRRSWGIGDLADVRRLGRWAAQARTARMLLLSPLHAPAPGLPQQASPYFPSSRQFRNPLHLGVEEVPGSRLLRGELAGLAARGRALNTQRRIDRDAVYRLKSQALELLWSRFPGDHRFDRYRAREGTALERYATFCALAERYHGGWRGWPQEYRHPDRPAVADFRDAHALRVGFHQWLQWLLDEQLRRAGSPLPLIADLAIGVDPDGADAWAWQDLLAPGIRIGAPPDAFAPSGQDWGLLAFDPWKLRQAAYEPYIQLLRAAFRHSGGLRLDHVMGLFRLYWIPAGMPAGDGAYVGYPSRDLLDILALESHRALAYVVGEDLGTVAPETRAELVTRRVLSYRLLWFEDQSPDHYPEQALAAVTTHDLPTIAGVWTEADRRAQQAAGLTTSSTELERMIRRLQEVTGLPRAAPIEDVVVTAYAALARSPCRLVTATLEDALGVEERPNMPGTTAEWPNWSLALPEPLEAIMRDPRLRRLAQAMAR